MSQTRLSINLSTAAETVLREAVDRQGITITEAVRRAVSTYKYMVDAHERGAKVIIEEPDGARREVDFSLAL